MTVLCMTSQSYFRLITQMQFILESILRPGLILILLQNTLHWRYKWSLYHTSWTCYWFLQISGFILIMLSFVLFSSLKKLVIQQLIREICSSIGGWTDHIVEPRKRRKSVKKTFGCFTIHSVLEFVRKTVNGIRLQNRPSRRINDRQKEKRRYFKIFRKSRWFADSDVVIVKSWWCRT